MIRPTLALAALLAASVLPSPAQVAGMPPQATPAAPATATPAPAPSAAPSATKRRPPRPLPEEAPGGGPDKVWVNINSASYHCPGDRFYGRTAHGRYMTEPAAKSAGAHGPRGKNCFAANK